MGKSDLRFSFPAMRGSTVMDCLRKSLPTMILYGAGYQASLVEYVKKEPALSCLLPLFYEKVASTSMVKHGMDVLR